MLPVTVDEIVSILREGQRVGSALKDSALIQPAHVIIDQNDETRRNA